MEFPVCAQKDASTTQKWLDTAHVTQVYYTYEVHIVFPPFEYFKDMELISLVQLYVEIE
jgi:hypothetical protein